MNKFLYPILILLFLTACSRREAKPVSPDADPANLPSITGDFALNGFDINGAEYGGVLSVRANEDGSYTLQWLVSESIQEGIGTIDGNRLFVNWATVEGFPNPLSGTAVYTITTAGELYGTKTIDGMSGQAEETAYPNVAENMSP